MYTTVNSKLSCKQLKEGITQNHSFILSKDKLKITNINVYRNLLRNSGIATQLVSSGKLYSL